MGEHGKRIRSLRLRNGWTQRELSERMFKAESTIGMWEQGRREPDYESLKQLSEIFNVSIDYIVGRTDNEHRNEPTLDETLQREMEGFEYALFGEVKDLNEDQKEDLLTMVRLFKKNLRD